MAKQLQRIYSFTPGTAGNGYVLIPGKIDQNQLLLITNATTNSFLYNFADPTYAGTTVTFNRGNNSVFPTAVMNSDGWTQVTFAIDTSAMSASHNIQIFTERPEIITRPWPMGTDAFERQRVAAPQAMIDADFEYGLQPTKWQVLEKIRENVGFYEVPGTDGAIVNITTDQSGGTLLPSVSSLITVNTVNPHGLTVGSGISIHGINSLVSSYNKAEGTFFVNSVPTLNQFTYYAVGQVGYSLLGGTINAGTDISTPYTVLRTAKLYYNSAISTGTFSVNGGSASTTASISVTYANPHGYVVGDTINVQITSDPSNASGHQLAAGTFVITGTSALNVLTYSARSNGTITGTPVGGVYAGPRNFFVHRPPDGGVMLSTDSPAHGAAAIRQTKKYMRYQSGKAMNFNTGILFAPNYYLRSATATNVTIGSTITVVTDEIDHGLQPAATISLTGVGNNYAGTYTVATIIDNRTFTVTATQVLTSVTASIQPPALVNHVNWHGSTVRVGTFDDQNGPYYQFDGIQMAIGLRNSVAHVTGVVNVTPQSNSITGTNTLFQSQLIAGDRVVIRGMTHIVTQVVNNTQIYVSPQYRGITATSGIYMTKTRDQIVPQSQWNLDRCDGSNGPFNPSGYNLVTNRMQMVGLQWTWYGAGFIDWMLRGPDGNYMTVHRIRNSNVNYEAWMRSGNMPLRYEVVNEGARSTLTNSILSSDTSLQIADTTFFPVSGTVYVDNELINYTGKTSTSGQGTLTNLTRAYTLGPYYNNIQQNFSAGAAASHSSSTGVILVSCTASPSVTHWGAAYLADGGFDYDRGYIFNYPSTNITVNTVKNTVFGIRLAPSVSNAVTGNLGIRDLINRAQLLLQGIEITCNALTSNNQAIIIEGVLNPQNYPNNPANMVWRPLIGTGAGTNTGQPSFSQIVPQAGIQFDGTATYATTLAATANTGTNVITVASTASMAVGDALQFAGCAGNSLITSIGVGTVTLSQNTYTTTTNGSQVLGYRNTWAVAGETIFTFISNPSERDVLDLTPLKELTNTPLGGQGCYPNGPDALFINIYLTQQPVNLTANVNLRWSETQS